MLVWRLDLAETGRALAEVPASAWLAIVGLAVLREAIAALRWRRVLGFLGRRERLGPLVADVLAGAAASHLLPTSFGGEVVRTWRCAARTGDGGAALASVAYERLIGMLVFAVVPALGLVLWPEALPEGAGPAVATVVAGGVGALVAAPRLLPMASRWLARWPSLREPVDRLADALAGPLRRWPARLETAAWSAAGQLVSLLPLVVAGAAWGEPALLGAVFVGVPLVLVASALPVTPGGLGVREALFVVVLAGFGLSPERSLALAVVWWASWLPPALPGLVLLVEPGGGWQQRGAQKSP